MKKSLFFFLLTLGLFAIACGGGRQTQEAAEPTSEDPTQQLGDEVMAIHDEVMPKMGKINQLSRELRAYLEENANLAEKKKETIRQTVKALEEADEGMMGWMAEYGDLMRARKEMETDRLLEALKKEKVKISEVRDQMLSSIEAGEKLLSEVKEE